MMIVKHLFRNENKLYGNVMLVLYTKIWKTFVFFVRKPAARFENQNVNPRKQYVSRLNSRTSIKKVWDMVRKIQGKGKSTSVNHLKKNNDNITSKKDIANTLADSFSKNSSSENYTSKFRNIKNQQEKQKLKFTSDNTENYNSEFLLSELTDALSKAHDTSPGPDDIHYQLLKHLPISTLLIFLEIFNNIWKTGNIP